MLILDFSLVKSFLFLRSDIFVEFINASNFYFQILALGITFVHISEDVTLALCVHTKLKRSRAAINGDVLHISTINTFLEIGIGKRFRGTRRTIARENEENESCNDNEIKPAEIESRSILLVLRLISLIIIVSCHLIQ